jgi:hypothetical protein
MNPSDRFNYMASVVRNVCNATLSLLFTLSLAIWGLVVNRKQAWRTDGGTAASGAGAILLALAYVALTISYIPFRDQFGIWHHRRRHSLAELLCLMVVSWRGYGH